MTSSRSSALAALSLLAAAACGREDVSHYRVPKEQPPPPALATPAGMTGAGAAAPAAPEGGKLRWTLPAGWTEGEGGAMRFASFKPSAAGRVDGSVVVLPGPAGGELANVNRWRNQIGLAPLDEAGLAAARKVVRTAAGPIAVYDFTGDGSPRSRTVAGFTVKDGNTWFVKLTGDADAVRAARADFMKLIGSLRFE